MIDLSKAALVASDEKTGRIAHFAQILKDEIVKRTAIELPTTGMPERREGGLILLGKEADFRGAGPFKDFAFPLHSLPKPEAEGYRLASGEQAVPFAAVMGADERGVLYGIGKLLRKMQLRKGSILLPKDLGLSSQPGYPLRGHQLGYRPKTNAYDAWSEQQFDQYIRELAFFGANSIEILPPRTDDDAAGPHLKVPPLQMMMRLSEIIDSYGLDVWIWYPNMGKDYSDERCLQQEIEERDEIFRNLKRIDHIFVPGGDPGEMDPDLLFEWCGKMAETLKKHHPHAKIWLSNQAFSQPQAWSDGFFSNVKKRPDWLGGIVFGPWAKTTLPELRELVPERYPIRRYPDITHSYACQYFVPNWDPALAMTLGRECINPRPIAEKKIHNMFHRYACGSLSYSEGINDDVNKFVWSDQDWDPDVSVVDTLRDYASVFISPDMKEEVTRGLLALEENLKGPLATNGGVQTTLRQWIAMESSAKEEVKENYRFQMGLLRAYYDAYIQRRLLGETAAERKIYDLLEQYRERDIAGLLEEAEGIMEEAGPGSTRPDYRKRCFELADSLFEKIGAQLTVEKHKAIAWNRGAFLDAIDIPLNNRVWLQAQFEKIRNTKSSEEEAKVIEDVLRREDPGPGGFYDNFGTPGSMKRISNPQVWEQDPGALKSAFLDFSPNLLYRTEDRKAKGISQAESEKIGPIHLAWIGTAASLYDSPLKAVYTNLNPEVDYTLRVTYVGVVYLSAIRSTRIRLTANGESIHDYIGVTRNCVTREFEIPGEIIENGKLELTWTTMDGDQGPHVAELWLMISKT
jgi:hypothetical protein